MTNKLALVLAILLGAALIADAALNEFAYTLFLARKLADLIEYVAFWR